MSYTGIVESGGRPDVRELPGLTITKVSVGPYDNNAYVLRCPVTGEQLLVDAANEAPRLLELIGDGPLARIVTTHRHQDHWMALSEVARATGAPVTAHPFDAEPLPEPVDDPVEHGGTVRVGRATLEVIHLRGHTPGSIALLYDAAWGARGPAAPVHRRQPLPGRGRQHLGRPDPVQAAAERCGGARLRPASRRDLVLPRSRQGLDPRPGAPLPPRVARPRLVAALTGRVPGVGGRGVS